MDHNETFTGLVCSNALPLVSCIMPTTAARKGFVPLALHYFQQQSYTNTELVIIDDEPGSIEHLVPGLSNIRYYRSSKKMSIGMKRNLACEYATGEYIMNWDDDDWYSAKWIEYQLSILQETKADICGLSSFYFYNPCDDLAWKYIYHQSKRAWVAGATFAYRRAHWRCYSYKDIQVGEDNDFVWNSKGSVVAHSFIEGFVSMLHKNNTSPKHTSHWQKHDTALIAALLKEDIHFYKNLQTI